ncbi:mCG1035304, isoform CRA_a [Mus musculus]|nr:mCG1035304, isoform CRA_a [Mus musculus]
MHMCREVCLSGAKTGGHHKALHGGISRQPRRGKRTPLVTSEALKLCVGALTCIGYSTTHHSHGITIKKKSANTPQPGRRKTSEDGRYSPASSLSYQAPFA